MIIEVSKDEVRHLLYAMEITTRALSKKKRTLNANTQKTLESLENLSDVFMSQLEESGDELNVFKVIAKPVRCKNKYDDEDDSDMTRTFIHYSNAKDCAEKVIKCVDVKSVTIVDDFRTGEVLYHSEKEK